MRMLGRLAVILSSAIKMLGPSTVEHLANRFGPVVIFLLLFACGLGLPLPEDIPLIVGGFFVATGKMNLVLVAILAWLGIIGGDCMLYMLGRRYGLNITRVPVIGKHFTEKRILKAEKLFERWGIWVVAVGRLIAGIRGGMVVAAGTIRFNFIKFIIADAIAAVFSGGLFLGLGYFLGKKLGSVDEIDRKIAPYKHWVELSIGILGILIIAYGLWRSSRRKSKATLPAENSHSAPTTNPPGADAGDVVGSRRSV